MRGFNENHKPSSQNSPRWKPFNLFSCFAQRAQSAGLVHTHFCICGQFVVSPLPFVQSGYHWCCFPNPGANLVIQSMTSKTRPLIKISGGIGVPRAKTLVFLMLMVRPNSRQSVENLRRSLRFFAYCLIDQHSIVGKEKVPDENTEHFGFCSDAGWIETFAILVCR